MFVSLDEDDFIETGDTLDLLRCQLEEITQLSPDDFIVFGANVPLIQFKIALLTPQAPGSERRIVAFEKTYPGAIAYHSKKMGIVQPNFIRSVERKPPTPAIKRILDESEIDAILARIPTLANTPISKEPPVNTSVPKELKMEPSLPAQQKQIKIDLNEIVNNAGSSASRSVVETLKVKLPPVQVEIKTKAARKRLSPLLTHDTAIRQQANVIINAVTELKPLVSKPRYRKFREENNVQQHRFSEHMDRCLNRYLTTDLYIKSAHKIKASGQYREFVVWLEAFNILIHRVGFDTFAYNYIGRRLILMMQKYVSHTGKPDPGCTSRSLRGPT